MSSGFNPIGALRRVFGDVPADERLLERGMELARIEQENLRARLGEPPTQQQNPFVSGLQSLGNFATLGIVPPPERRSTPVDPSTLDPQQQETYNQFSPLQQELIQARDPRAFANILVNGRFHEDTLPQTEQGQAVVDTQRFGSLPPQPPPDQVTTKAGEWVQRWNPETKQYDVVAKGAPQYGIMNPGGYAVNRETGELGANAPHAPRDVAPNHIVVDPNKVGQIIATNERAEAAGSAKTWIPFKVPGPGGATGMFNTETQEKVILGYGTETVNTPAGAQTNVVGGVGEIPVQSVAESASTTTLGPEQRGATTSPRTGAMTVQVDAMPRLSEVAKTDRLFVTDSSGNTKMVAGAVPEPLRPSAKELLNYFTPESVKAAWVADGDYSLLEERPEAASDMAAKAKGSQAATKLALDFRRRFEKVAEPHWEEAMQTRTLLGAAGMDDPTALDPEVAKATRLMLGLQPGETIPKSNAARDIAMIFAFMKTLDPPSVVRESEQELIRNARSLFGKAGAFAERILTGKQITDEQRAQMIETAIGAVAAKQRPYFSLVEKFRELATEHGVDPDLVVVDAMDDIRQLIGEGGGGPGGSAWDSIMQAEQSISSQGGAVSRRTMLEALQKAGVEDMSEEDAAKFNKAYPE